MLTTNTASLRRFALRRPLLAAVALLSAATTACSDTNPLAPAADVDAAAFSPRAIVHATTVAVAGDTTVQTFTVAPGWDDSYVIDGVHRVDLQAGSVCDPALTAYGPGEWDKPCTPITKPLTFTAKSWTDSNGHARVSFAPDVRFVPGKTNTLTLKDKATAAALANAEIAWCPTGSRSCVDEGATDASLATRLNSNGTLSRRVKHFSGYTVLAD